MLRPLMKLALPLALLALAGCDAKAKSDACYASSVGSCSSEQATSCGVQLTCDDQIPRELKCTPPDSELPMACECIEAGKSTQKLELDAAIGADLPKAGGLATARCGWTLKTE